MKKLIAVVLAAMLVFSTAIVCLAGDSDGDITKEYLGEDLEDDIEDISDFEITLSKDAFTYTSKEIKPNVTVISKSEALVENRDFTVDYLDNINAGCAEVIITGINSYKGTVQKEFRIIPRSIVPKITLSKTSYAYNGKEKKPTVSVYKGDIKLASKYYDISYEKGRKNVGSYKVSVSLKGNYSGKGSASFNIKPKATALISLEAGSKKLTVTFKKQTEQITGYQLQYATNSSFTANAVKKSISDKNINKKTISSLNSKTRYFVRVRTYKTVGETKYYSDWSEYMSVKIK